MKNTLNIAVVGLGQIGIYLLNELNSKKKDIFNKTGKNINIVAVSAKNKNKKRKYSFNKKIFFKNPLEIFNKKRLIFYLKLLDYLMVFLKKLLRQH